MEPTYATEPNDDAAVDDHGGGRGHRHERGRFASESRKAGFGIPKALRPAFRGNSAVPPGGEQGSGVEEREGSIRPRASPGCLPRPPGSEVWTRRPLSLAPGRARPAGAEMNSFGRKLWTIDETFQPGLGPAAKRKR